MDFPVSMVWWAVQNISPQSLNKPLVLHIQQGGGKVLVGGRAPGFGLCVGLFLLGPGNQNALYLCSALQARA